MICPTDSQAIKSELDANYLVSEEMEEISETTKPLILTLNRKDR